MNVECIDFELGAAVAAAEPAGHPDRILERDREERERREKKEDQIVSQGSCSRLFACRDVTIMKRRLGPA